MTHLAKKLPMYTKKKLRAYKRKLEEQRKLEKEEYNQTPRQKAQEARVQEMLRGINGRSNG